MSKQIKFIARVHKNKTSGQKLVTVPKKLKDIQDGDYIEAIKIEVNRK